MGFNIPRPWKRPPTPEPPKRVTIKSVVVKPEKKHVTNCPNCCAVITGPFCEYCGTRFRDDPEKAIVKFDGIVAFKEMQKTAYDLGLDLKTPGLTEELR